MLTDVLTALREASGFARRLVVSRDPATLQLAEDQGAEPLSESGPSGYRAAAEQAAAAALAAGASGLLVLPADLPLATARDLEHLLLESAHAAITLVPSRHGGTNALLTRPPGAIPYRYGADSFHAHLRAAERRRLQTAVLDLPNLGLDIDQPGDLRRLLQHEAPQSHSATGRYLAEIGLAERLQGPDERGRVP